MKNLILVFMFILSSCISPPPILDDNKDKPKNPDKVCLNGEDGCTAGEDDTPFIPVLYSFEKVGNLIYLNFEDGTQKLFPYTGKASIYKNYIAVDNVLYKMDCYGNILSSKLLSHIPDLLFVNTAGDSYTIRNIPKEEAYAAGALYKIYAEIYVNNTAYNTWYLPEFQFETTSILDANDGFVIRISDGTYKDLSGTYNNIYRMFKPDNILFYDYDYINKTGKINKTAVSWLTSRMGNAHFWIKANNKYYSNNGYEFLLSNNTLKEEANITWQWGINKFDGEDELPFMMPFFAIIEHSEQVIYFINMNTGILYKFIPSVNTYSYVMRIWNKVITRSLAGILSDSINNQIIGNYVYYTYEATVYRFHMVNQTNEVYGSDKVMYPYSE